MFYRSQERLDGSSFGVSCPLNKLPRPPDQFFSSIEYFRVFSWLSTIFRRQKHSNALWSLFMLPVTNKLQKFNKNPPKFPPQSPHKAIQCSAMDVETSNNNNKPLKTFFFSFFNLWIKKFKQKTVEWTQTRTIHKWNKKRFLN